MCHGPGTIRKSEKNCLFTYLLTRQLEIFWVSTNRTWKGLKIRYPTYVIVCFGCLQGRECLKCTLNPPFFYLFYLFIIVLSYNPITINNPSLYISSPFRILQPFIILPTLPPIFHGIRSNDKIKIKVLTDEVLETGK